ncbi:arginine--tRNA ligase [Kitasatospora xanthocidica]|uniref:Arginine--tRNA ligase n=1 Tax=Kitasatospora xanthocidica TaxID=83382 RepID=A0A372ZPT9_9ACTN|nr:arginine--tRNA ligase [Kitasatospora xanthocidica]RGD57492.1 arginine--tRNA ligase [Kitasatospora xanthocidica]
MAPIVPLSEAVRQCVAEAIGYAVPEITEADPQLRRSDRADFQVNGILGLAKALRKNPRELAGKVAEHIPLGDLIAGYEVSGPGFINLTVTPSAILDRASGRLADDRLGVPPAAAPGTTVIDYSQPNIAKEMHVGHLRSTIIGDALVRILEFGGETVHRQNHIGDWGTQFGMLIQYLAEHPEADAPDTGGTDDGPSMSRLNRLYRAARAEFDGDPAFADRARTRVVALQAGDRATVDAWRRIVDESKVYFNAVYDRLGVRLQNADAVGESFYNDMLADVCADLEESGVAVRSDGALCVFFDDIKGADGQPVPLIVRKSDGGYGYATTDLAAIRHRRNALGADRILYVVDSRQALHFRMVFETARRAGWIDDGLQVLHLPFGTVLGKDGKPFKTRSGETVRLMDLLDEAVDRAAAVVSEKNPGLSPDELAPRAAQVGIGAVKYADLSTSRSRDYLFDVDRMVSLNGDTGAYLQYAHARIRSVLRRAPQDVTPQAHGTLALEPSERALGLALDAFGDAVGAAAAGFEPHRLAAYLFDLASAFTAFYEHCPVLKAGDRRVLENRLLLCGLTGETLRLGMELLGLEAPERL